MQLRTKIAITMLSAASLPLVAAMTISLMYSTNQVQALTLESAQGNVTAGAEKLSGYFATRMAEISAYANMPLLRRMSWPEIGPFLHAELERHDGIYEKLVLGLPGEGHFYTTSAGNPAYGGLVSFDDNNPGAKLKSISQRDYWRNAVGDNERGERVTCISDPMISYTTGVRQVMAASTILSDDGEILGMIGGTLPWEEIDARVKEIGDEIEHSFSNRARFCLVSRRGIYMYHWNPEKIIHLNRDAQGEYVLNDIGERTAIRRRITEEQDQNIAEAGRNMVTGQSGTTFYTDESTGEEMAMVYAPVRSAKYSLAMTMPKADIVGAVANLRSSLAAITIISIALVITVSWILAQRISKPITALSATAKTLAGGDQYDNIAAAGDDEVAELSRAFHHMTGSLLAREKALRESERRLQTILDSIQTGVVVVDVDTRLIVEANPMFLRMIGAAREQVIGQPCQKFGCSAQKGYCPVIDGAKEVESKEVELQTCDGLSLPVLKTVSLALLNGRRQLLESMVDISDRKRAVEELQRRMNEESEAKRRLQVFVSDASGREKRMVELKQEVNELLLTLGKEHKYEAPRRVAEMNKVFSSQQPL